MEWKKLERGVFLINVLGIIYNRQTRKILIGRRENDPYLKRLTWCFPGGTPGYESDLENYLEEQIKIKTRLEVKVLKVIFAKTYPEKRDFLSIYYLCEPIGGAEKPGELFVEIKWVKPMEVINYFKTSTSIHPKLIEFLKSLA